MYFRYIELNKNIIKINLTSSLFVTKEFKI